VVDLLEKEILLRSTASGKRSASDSAGGQVKKLRMEVPRPSWIEGSSLTAKRNDVGFNRGCGGDRGGGRSGPGYRGGRGFYPSSRGGRGRFFPHPGSY
jgi:hypothetical protein